MCPTHSHLCRDVRFVHCWVRFVLIDGVSSNKMAFTFSRPTITSLAPSVVPTTGFSNAELIGDSFGDCTGVLQCYLRVQVTFPSYSIVVDLSDKVRRRFAVFVCSTSGTGWRRIGIPSASCDCAGQ